MTQTLTNVPNDTNIDS